MVIRFAPLLAAAVLGSLAAPVLAQDDARVPPPLPELDVDLPPPEEVTSGTQTDAAAEEGWQGEWQGEWSEDGVYRGTWSGTYSDPGPTATRVIPRDGAAATGYSPAERTAWLNQCRNVYYPGSAATGAVVAAPTDVCLAYLEQYERSYAFAAQGAVPAAGISPALPAVPGPYPSAAYGYPYPPVMWVRVPIIRQSAPASGD